MPILNINQVKEALSEHLETVTSLQDVFFRVRNDTHVYQTHPYQNEQHERSVNNQNPIESLAIKWNAGLGFITLLSSTAESIFTPSFNDYVVIPYTDANAIDFEGVLYAIHKAINIAILSNLLSITRKIGRAKGIVPLKELLLSDDKPELDNIDIKTFIDELGAQINSRFGVLKGTIESKDQLKYLLNSSETTEAFLKVIADEVIKPKLSKSDEK